MFEVVEATLLLDYYGSLLTERTQEIMQLYYNEDWSLAEIADRLKVSRQSVHDTLKRGLENLSHYEQNLQLLQKQVQRRSLLNKINDTLRAGLPGKDRTAEIHRLLVKLAAIDQIEIAALESPVAESRTKTERKGG